MVVLDSNTIIYLSKELISYFTVVYIDEKISHKVAELRKVHKIKLPDAII